MIINKTDEIKAADYLNELRKKMIYFIPFPLILFLQLMNMQLCRITKQRMELTFRLKKTVFILLIQVDNILMDKQISQELLFLDNLRKNNKIVLRVYKGHISIALATFKINTKGSALDPLARKSLLDIGCDYDHGTGHGVGSFFKCS